MKIGMNLLLWATHVTEEHYPHLEKIKSTGFDGVEVPIFGGDDAHYRKLRTKLDELQLKASTVTVATPEASAISPDPAIRKAATERLKTIVRQSAILGADVLCGPSTRPWEYFPGPDRQKKNSNTPQKCTTLSPMRHNARAWSWPSNLSTDLNAIF